MQVPEILACSLEKYFAVQRKNAGFVRRTLPLCGGKNSVRHTISNKPYLK